jgi:hypothetical protein
MDDFEGRRLKLWRTFGSESENSPETRKLLLIDYIAWLTALLVDFPTYGRDVRSNSHVMVELESDIFLVFTVNHTTSQVLSR